MGSRPARVSASSSRACGGSASSASTCSSPTTGIPMCRSPRPRGALEELKAEGKIGAYGLSNVDGPQLREALAAPARFDWVQNSYSLLDRDAEREVLPLCAAHGLGFTPFSPLAGGWLTGKYRRGAPAPAGSRMTMRPEPYEHLRDRPGLRRPRGARAPRRPGDARLRVAPRRPARDRASSSARADPSTCSRRSTPWASRSSADVLSRLFE